MSMPSGDSTEKASHSTYLTTCGWHIYLSTFDRKIWSVHFCAQLH